MRIHFSNTDRPKAAAKLLVRETENVKLADAQEAIAGAIGYRDWYDFTAASKPDTPTTILQAAQWKAVILSVTDALGVGYGDALLDVDTDMMPAIREHRMLALPVAHDRQPGGKYHGIERIGVAPPDRTGDRA